MSVRRGFTLHASARDATVKYTLRSVRMRTVAHGTLGAICCYIPCARTDATFSAHAHGTKQRYIQCAKVSKYGV